MQHHLRPLIRKTATWIYKVLMHIVVWQSLALRSTWTYLMAECLPAPPVLLYYDTLPAGAWHLENKEMVSETSLVDNLAYKKAGCHQPLLNVSENCGLLVCGPVCPCVMAGIVCSEVLQSVRFSPRRENLRRQGFWVIFYPLILLLRV